MKKLFLFALAVLFAANVNAQISVGVGYGLASHTYKTIAGNQTTKVDPTNMSGFYIGGAYEWNFLSKNWGNLSLQPGLTYSFYGKRISFKEETVAGVALKSRDSRRDHYLDIPVHFKYSYDFVPGKFGISAFAGPVFSFGLAATSISKEEAGSYWVTERYSMYSGNYKIKGVDDEGKSVAEKGNGGDSNYSMFDLKLGVGIAATVMEKIDFRIAYNIGLLDRYTGKVDNFNAISHTNVFSIGVAYNF